MKCNLKLQKYGLNYPNIMMKINKNIIVQH